MSITSGLCRELRIVQDIIDLAGNPPEPIQPRSCSQHRRTASDLLRHIQAAEQAASAIELGDRLHAETACLLAGIQRHVYDVVKRAETGGFSRSAAGAVIPTNEALAEQFAELRDKSLYPIVEALRRLSVIAAAAPIPADVMTSDRATQLFFVTRETLKQAVQDGDLQPYRDVREPKHASRRFSGAQLAKLYDRRP